VGHEYGPQTTPIPLNSVQSSNADAAKSLAVQNLLRGADFGKYYIRDRALISCSNRISTSTTSRRRASSQS